MSIFDRLLTRWRSRKVVPATIEQIFGGGDSESAVLRDPFANHATLNRCVHILASNLSAIDFRLFEGTDEEPNLLRDGDWYQLFLSPNSTVTRREWWEGTITSMALDGDAFWILMGRGGEPLGEFEVPSSMWLVRGSYAQEILSTDRASVEAWRFTTTAGTATFPVSSVVQLKYQYDPSNPFRGTTPIRALRSLLRMDARANNYNETFFDNDASPGVTVTFPESVNLDAKQRKEIRDELEAHHRGWNKAHRALVLANGAKAEILSQTHKDMEFLGQIKWNRDTIASTMGVPLFHLGEEQQLTFASAEEATRKLWVGTLLPLATKIEDTLEARLFTARTEPKARALARAKRSRVVWGAWDTEAVAALKRDLSDRLEQADRAMSLGVSFNEANERLQLGFPAQELGDTHYLKQGLIPVELAIEGGGAQGGMPPPTPPETPPETPPAAPDAPTPPETPPAEPPKRNREVESVDPAVARRQATLATVHRKGMNPLDKRFETAIKAHFHRMRDKLLKAVATLPAARARDAEGNPDIDAILADLKKTFDRTLLERLRPLYLAGVRLGASTLDEQIPGGLTKFSVESPAVLDFLKKKEVLVTSVNDTALEGIRTTLAEGIGKTENLEQLQDRVRESMGASSARSLGIARTESAQVVNGSRFLAAKAEGISRMEWLAVSDGHARASHAALDGEIRDLGQPFANGLLFPGDISGDAEELVNCRCSSGPVLD